MCVSGADNLLPFKVPVDASSLGPVATSSAGVERTLGRECRKLQSGPERREIEPTEGLKEPWNGDVKLF